MKFRAILLALAATAAAPSAMAHAFLQGAVPAAGATVDGGPTRIDLHFSEALEPAFSRIEVTDASGRDMSLAGVVAHGAEMSIALKALGPGAYRVKWRAMSIDTHRSEGNYTFRVAP